MRTHNIRTTSCCRCHELLAPHRGRVWRCSGGQCSEHGAEAGWHCSCQDTAACDSRMAGGTLRVAIDLIRRSESLTGIEIQILSSLLDQCHLVRRGETYEVVCPTDFIREELSRSTRLDEIQEALGVQVATSEEELRAVEVVLGVEE